MIIVIRVKQVKVDVRYDNNEELYNSLVRKLKINVNDIVNINIVKKSIDARHKDNVCFVYEVDVEVRNESRIKFDNDISLSSSNCYSFVPSGNLKLSNQPVVVGSGPCGLFCAYELAKFGYKPIVIERGDRVEKRVEEVTKFWNTGVLNPNSNVQFGEGGAGTFSDG